MQPPDDVSLREARDADARAIAAVHEASIREFGAAAYDDAVVEAWAAPVDPDEYDLEPEDGRFLVAERADGTVVGFGEARFVPPEYCSAPADGDVRAVYVAPEHAREGVGTAILSRLEASARDADLDALGALCSLNAVEFYRRRDWTVVEERTHEFGGEVQGSAVEMRTEL